MEYVILDFEFNGTYSKKLRGYFNEIIDIGALKVDENMKIIDEFSVLIKPKVSKKMNKYVEKLTHITMEELLNNGISFPKAMSLLKKFLSDSVLVTWSISDIKALSDNYKYFLGIKNLDFIKNFLDLQGYCQRAMKSQKDQKLGLSTTLKLLNIDLNENNIHHALYDSFLSYKCFCKLYNEDLIKLCTENCESSDFYRKINFKNSTISDLSETNIDINYIDFHCNLCGKKAVRLTDWKVKNKIFKAEYKCDNCRENFIAKIKFKKTYDGIKIKKTECSITENNDHKLF